MRIRQLNRHDIAEANRDMNAEEAAAQNKEKLAELRTLRTLLAIVGKCVSEGHYNSVVRHSTSLTWMYNML